jgi:hypothetical protein
MVLLVATAFRTLASRLALVAISSLLQVAVAAATAADPPLCTSVPGRPTFHPCGELLAGTQHTTHANDINAIFWYRGMYHAMFQERKPYPCADWAHLVSTNLATWKRLPDALVPTKHSFDGGGVLDGSLSVLPGLPPVILYDAHNPERGRDCPIGRVPRMNVTVAGRSGGGGGGRANDLRSGDPPTIGIAHPKNASDPELREWSKSHTLVKFPRGRYSGPTRIWYNVLLKNYNLLMINGANANSIYSTTDTSFTTWTGGAPFAPASVQGGCGRSFARIPGTDPPLFMVQSNISADPNDGANAGGWYAVGHYNLTSNRFTPTVSGASPQPIDFGTLFCNELGADDPAQGRLLFLWNMAARDVNHSQNDGSTNKWIYGFPHTLGAGAGKPHAGDGRALDQLRRRAAAAAGPACRRAGGAAAHRAAAPCADDHRLAG